MVTDNKVCNELAHFSRLQVIENDTAPDSDFPFRLPSAAPHQRCFVGENLPTHLTELKQENVIYLLPLVVPFS